MYVVGSCGFDSIPSDLGQAGFHFPILNFVVAKLELFVVSSEDSADKVQLTDAG